MIDNKSAEEYLRIYAPWEPTNNCCFICKKCIDGCSWSKSLKPIPGWKAVKGKKKPDEAHYPYKIYFCPEFEEGDASKGREYDEENSFNLIEAIYRKAAEDFKEAYKRKLKTERLNSPLYEEEIRIAESVMIECSFLLGEWADILKEKVEKELELEEGNADG